MLHIGCGAARRSRAAPQPVFCGGGCAAPTVQSVFAQNNNRYFPSFEALSQAVLAGLTQFQNDPAAVKQLMGPYLEQMADLALAA